MKTVLGSETEFGIIPRGKNWPKNKDVKKTTLFLNCLEEKLNSRFYNEIEANRLESRANWWGENLRNAEFDSLRPSFLEIVRRLGISGTYASNGARLYVDAYHPEYSSPECHTPQELVVYERAGEEMMSEIVRLIENFLEVKVDLLKRNWDYHNSSYACHENYLVSSRLFDKLLQTHWLSYFSYNRQYLNSEQFIWVLHLGSRQIFTGNGRLDIRKTWPDCFSLSQRQPFIKYFKHVNTTQNRAIINTRNRPYADPKRFGRLHVICGDSNRADWSNFLKYGTSRLVLLWLEDFKDCGFTKVGSYILKVRPEEFFLNVANTESQFLTKKGIIKALDCQYLLFEGVKNWLEWREKNYGTLSWAEEVMKRWLFVLDAFRSRPDDLTDKLDWKIKERLFREELDNGKNLKHLFNLDYNYHVVHRDSLFNYLVLKGRIESIVTKIEIEKAKITPPASRAKLRSLLRSIFSDEIAYVSWHYLGFRDSRLREIGMPDPTSFSEFYTDDQVLSYKVREILEKNRGE
jgi:hypothetical protein